MSGFIPHCVKTVIFGAICQSNIIKTWDVKFKWGAGRVSPGYIGLHGQSGPSRGGEGGGGGQFRRACHV